MLLFLAVLTLLLGSPQANTTTGSTTPQQAQQPTTSGTPPQQTPTSVTPPQQAEPVVSRARRLSEVPAAGPIVLPMELVAGRPVVRLTVNGKGPYAFLVSTGATTTMIDEKLAAELLLKPPVVDQETEKELAKEKESAKDRETAKEKEKEPAKEKEQAKDGGRKPPVMLELELESGTTKLSKVQTLSTDISKYLTDAGLAGKSRGVLSLSAWKNQLVTISFPPKWRLTIEPGALPEDGADTFPLDPDTGELRLSMTIADQTVPVRVEPLMPGGLVLPESMMKALLMDGKPIDLDPIHAGGQTIPVREARLANSAVLATFELQTP